MRVSGVTVVLAILTGAFAKECPASKSNSKLFCYYSKLTDVDGCYCTHVILPANADVKTVDRVWQLMRGVKILVTVNEFNQGLIDILKTSKVDGLEINLKKLDSKNDISDFISTVRSKLGSDLYLALSVPSKAETLAKYYDFKALSKYTNVFILQTAFLGASKNVTFHPSRLSGLWDMQNTDSIVDLVSGLGAPLSKVAITAPVQAFHFTLQNEEYSAPGSPALELKSLTRDDLCEEIRSGSNWTLERDQDQAGPYIFSGTKWIAFEDSSSIDIKAKYSRVRGLAGLALKDLSQDGGQKCGVTILESAYNGLSRQARAPRGAVLHSLEREMLESSSRPLDNVQVSPYRITRIVDVEGHHHIIRQDTRTEFTCSRQGYFVHPRSCNRFYRCVKFDQLSDEYSVFEFDCPAGLAFDERVEVCVWPGSLPQGQACAGSSEIAPVPRERFICPNEPGYYADPENCRWFFACLDHGKSPLSAYEFRCPFGLVFDSDRLLCEWSWLVPKCASGSGLGINLATDYHYGGAAVGTGYQSGVVLDQYDGLGSLGVVRLGGIEGRIEQPIIYSNIDSDGFSGNYRGGFRGLGLKATQTLQNAGLLRTNIGVDTNVFGSNIQHSSGTAGYSGSGTAGYSGTNYQANSGALNAGFSQYSNVNTAEGIDASRLALAGSLGEKTSQNDLNRNVQYSADAAQGFGSYHSALDQNHAQVEINNAEGIDASRFALAGSFGEKTSQNDLNKNVQYSAGAAQGFVSYHSALDQNHAQVEINHAEGIDASRLALAGSFGEKTSQNDLNRNVQYSAGTAQGFGSYHSALDQNHAQVAINQGLGNVQYQTDSSSNHYGQNEQLGVRGSSLQTQYASDAARGSGSYQYSAQTNNNQNEQAVVNQGVNNVQYHTDFLANGNGERQNYGANIEVTQGFGAEQYKNKLTGYSTDDGLRSSVNDLTINIHNQQPNEVRFQYNVGSDLVDESLRAKSTFGQYQGERDQVVRVASESSDSAGGLNTNNFASQYTGTSDNIDIIGGGYSAVGQSKSGIEIYNNGESNLGFVQTTAAPVSVTTYASIPTVTSVPLPTLKTATGFESYNGGVIANIPELQYKLYGNAGVANSTSSYVKYVSTTPSSVFSGYDYQKPSVVFTEGQTYQKPLVQVAHQSAYEGSYNGAKSYSYQSQNSQGRVGEQNAKPSEVFPEGQTYQKPSVQVAHQSAYEGSYNAAKSYSYQSQNSQGRVEEQNANIYTVSSTIQPEVNVREQVGYAYPKPQIQFEESPVKTVSPSIVSTYQYSTPSTPKPFTFEQKTAEKVVPLQPVSNYNFQGYSYDKPSIKFEERPQVQVSSYNEISSSKPVQQQPQVYVSSTFAPTVEAQPAPSFSYVQEFENKGYDYPKPTVRFEEKPAERQRPLIVSKFSIRKPVVQETYVQPEISSYNYQNEAVSNGYYYEKPSVRFEEKPLQPTIQPAVLNYQYSTPKTVIQPVEATYQKPVTRYSFKDIVLPTKVEPVSPIVKSYLPATQQTITYQQSHQSVQPAVVSTYHYQKPSVTRYTFKDVISKPIQPVVSTYLPATEKTLLVQPTFKPFVSTYLPATEKSVVSTYLPPIQNRVIVQKQPVSTYLPVTEEPIQLPEVVSSYNYVTPTTPKPISSYSYSVSSTANPQLPTIAREQQEAENKGYRYPKPSVSFEEEPVSFVETYEHRQPVEEELFIKKHAYVTGNLSPSGPVVVENYQAPLNENYEKVRAKVYSQSIDSSSSYNYNNFKTVSSTAAPVQQIYVQSTPAPIYYTSQAPELRKITTQEPEFHFYDSRLSSKSKESTQGYSYPKPEIRFKEKPSTAYLPVPTREYLPSQSTTTSRPISKYSFSSLDEEYQYVSTPSPTVVQSTTPLVRQYLPVKQRVKVTTALPTFVVPEVTVPSRAYLPGRSKVRYTTTAAPVEVTTLSREYLPVRSRIRVTTNGSPIDELEVTSRRPAKIVRVVRPGTKTIIKQNDLQPFLSAKLGAQCTCVSNTLNLKKKQKIIIVEDEDEDDGYVVENDEQGGTVVENYRYEPQKVVDITPTPEIYIKSTTNDIAVPTPTYPSKKRVRVRPISTTTTYELSEDVSGQYTKEDDVSDREIVKAVRTGLKLVKQAAKEGAKEGTEEVISKYNPRTGNVRETIDCQRAGLFRHPTQCNKFYACRWDCTKNKFTLHTFNCPVHLTFDNSLGACNWPSQGPACTDNTLLPSD